MSSLIQAAEELRVSLTDSLDAKLGQHFTPRQAAELIASMPNLDMLTGKIRVLDPGAGSGSLTAALVQRLLDESNITALELVAVEFDPSLEKPLAMTLSNCQQAAEAAGVSCTVQQVEGDFIQLAAGLEGHDFGLFDLVILNPPYGKLATKSDHRRLMQGQGVETGNLYAAFVALGVQLLAANGQLVAITPRSWANGTYFTQFRGWLFDRVSIDRIHVFDSRGTVFSDTKVLQETIVFAVSLGTQKPEVVISTSVAHLDEPKVRNVRSVEVIAPNDDQKFMRIPGDKGGEIERLMAALPCSLKDLGIKVSTGKVVDFRSRNNLNDSPAAEDAPLIYPVNFSQGRIIWPVLGKKAQGFAILDEADRKLLLPPGDYVLIKRFSAKEERRRIVAAVWEDDGNSPAFENHLNVFNADGKGLDRALAQGLCWWLNSTFVDDWFRTFSGHTQVNAGDLKALRLPSAEQLRSLGTQGIPAQDKIDQTVSKLVNGAMAAA